MMCRIGIMVENNNLIYLEQASILLDWGGHNRRVLFFFIYSN